MKKAKKNEIKIYCPNNECTNEEPLDENGSFCPECGEEYSYYGAPKTPPSRRKKKEKNQHHQT